MTIDYKHAIEIYTDNHALDESDIVPLLQDIGMSLEQAERIVVFAPIAFGREIISSIENIQVSDVFAIEYKNSQYKLRYVQFAEFNDLCGFAYESRINKIIRNDDYMKVANRSCELSAVSQALNKIEKKGNTANLQMLKGARFKTNQIYGYDNLIGAKELDVILSNNSYALNLVNQLLAGHKIESFLKNEWLLSIKHKTKIKCEWLPSPTFAGGQLDVLIQHGDNPIIKESFSGLGSTNETAIENAIDNFLINSLHVILDAFMGYHDLEQILTEEWQVNGQTYIASIGNLGTKASHGDHPGIPDNLFEKIENTIKTEPLENDIHAFRLYYGHMNNEDSHYEALLDNNIWQNGVNLIESIKWLSYGYFYSVRQFIVLKKKPIEKPSFVKKVKALFK
jgi:hypothetical protein